MIIDCVFKNNVTGEGDGGGICSQGSSIILRDCTIEGNVTYSSGGGIFTDSNPIIANCILWNNIATDSGCEAYNYSTSPTFCCCDIAGGINGPGLSGESGVFAIDSGGNINIDPKFENASNRCYQLLISSSCIDAGNNQAVVGTDTDIAGNPRTHGPKIDIGAYENQYPLPQYSLTASVIGNHGTVDPGSGIYDYGTKVTLTVVPKAGYCVKAWHGADIPTTSSTNTVTMDSDKEVSVEFELVPVSLAILVPGGHGVVPGTSGNYGVGSLVKITATPDPGYRVEGWYDINDVLLSTEDAIEVLMDSDKIISVIFEKISDTITLSKCEDAPVFSEEIIFSAGNLKNGTFNYRGSNGRITSLKCDVNNNTFSITAKSINLTGLSSPVVFEIEIGDYIGVGVAYDGEVLASGGNTDIINGKQLMPMQFADFSKTITLQLTEKKSGSWNFP